MKTKGREPDHAEEEVANTIYEFLQWANLDETLSSFVSECKKRKVKIRSLQDASASGNSDLKEDLMTAFEDEDSGEFFRLWATAFNGKDRDKQTQVLEFYLHVYFATAPLRDSNAKNLLDCSRDISLSVSLIADNSYNEQADCNETWRIVISMSKNFLTKSMDGLKSFLEEGEGSKLSQIPELVPYFALPYVANPKQHPLFKDLTQRDSSEDKSSSDSRDKSVKLEQRCISAEKTAQKYKDLYSEIQKDYHKQITISAELVDALEQTLKGVPVSTEYLEEMCSRIMESNKAAQTHDVQTNSLNLAAPEPTSAVSTQPPSMLSTLEDDMGSFRSQVLSLNYPKIRNQVSQHPAQRETVLLLQALRWRLTQAPKEVREPQLIGFCSGDVVGIKTSSQKSGKQNLANSVFNCDSKQSKESMSRLLNTLASTKTGRSYLSSHQDGRELLLAMVTALKTRKLEAFSQEHSLATLQKLSLRKKIQLELIRIGTVEWLVQFLTTYTRLSDYALEYGCALLMNLSLNTVGKQACARNPETLVKLLINLIQHKNEEIHPYVNGILYSTLGVPKIRRKAQDMGMDAVIEDALESSKNSNDSKQLPFVLKQLRGELSNNQNVADSDDETSAEEEEDEEDDYLEIELDSNDTICGKPGDLIGEALLRARYLPSQTSIPKNVEKPAPEKAEPKSRNTSKSLGSRPLPPEPKQPVQSEPPGMVPPRLPEGPPIPRRTHTASTFTVADGRQRPQVKNRAPRDAKSNSPRKAPPGVTQEKPALPQNPMASSQGPVKSLSVARQNRHISPLRAGNLNPNSANQEVYDITKTGLSRSARLSPPRAQKQPTNQGKTSSKDKTSRNESPPSNKVASSAPQGTKTAPSNRPSRSESPTSKGTRIATQTAKIPSRNESPTRKPPQKSEPKEVEMTAKEKIAVSRKQRLNSLSENKKSPEKSPETSLRSEKEPAAPLKPSIIPRSKESSSLSDSSRKRSQSQSLIPSRDKSSRDDRDPGDQVTKQRARSNSGDQGIPANANSGKDDPEVTLRAPTMGKMNTRIPNEANELEYAQIFGARPKLIRTPDAEALKKRNNAMMMFF